MPSQVASRFPPPQRILAVLPGWVGDTVLATPALHALRTQYPGAHVTLLGKAPLLAVLADGGFADDAVAWTAGAKKPGKINVLKLSRILRERNFDTAVLFPNSFRSALVAWLAGVPRRVGFSREGRGIFLNDKLHPQREGGKFVPVSQVDYYNEIAERVGCERIDRKLRLGTIAADEKTIDDRLHGIGAADHHPLVIVHTGASFGAAKCWIPERFAELGDRLIDELGAAVLLTCGPNEVDSVPQIAAMMRKPAVVLNDPLLSIGELKALLRRIDLLVTNDTGPRHFPIAFDLPVVTIFGATDPRWTETNHPLERKCLIPVDCGPCQQRVCPLGHLKCMTGVTTEMVFTAARDLLATRPV